MLAECKQNVDFHFKMIGFCLLIYKTTKWQKTWNLSLSQSIYCPDLCLESQRIWFRNWFVLTESDHIIFVWSLDLYTPNLIKYLLPLKVKEVKCFVTGDKMGWNLKKLLSTSTLPSVIKLISLYLELNSASAVFSSLHSICWFAYACRIKHWFDY